MDKKFVVIVSGVGDTFFSDKSKKKLKASENLLEQTKKALKHLSDKKTTWSFLNLNYSSDTTKDINVFGSYKDSRMSQVKINSRNSFLDKANELTIKEIDGTPLLFNNDQFTFIFPSREYDIYLMGVDLYGIFGHTIKELLDEGYNVKVFSDVISALPPTHKLISSLSHNDRFEFCSYRSV